MPAPTRPLPLPRPLPLSRSEIEATALKASRGAGMAWGMAEEAAFATLWLADHGIDGLALLARHLDRLAVARAGAGVKVGAKVGAGAGSALQITAAGWHCNGVLCPLTAGAALGDHFDLVQGPLQRPVVLSDLSAPALILPFLAAAAARTGAVVVVGWPGVTVVLSAGDLLAIAGDATLMADHANTVTVTATVTATLTATMTATVTATVTRMPDVAPCLAVQPGPWQALQAHVQRTYVPASDQSRRGAGAAGSDNS